MPKHACARLTPQDLCARNFIKGPGRRTPRSQGHPTLHVFLAVFPGHWAGSGT